MTATLAPPFEAVGTESVADSLTRVHDHWMERIARLLAPATMPRATFWDRWAAVRFLADQFEDRFRLELELVESLASRLTPSTRARLAAARAGLDRTRAELMAAGRRQGRAAEVVLLARRFLDQTRRWCASLELATASMHPDDLPERSQELLARLRATAGLDP